MSRSSQSTFRSYHHVRLPSWWTHVVVCLLCATLIPHAAAFDNEYALGPIRQQSHGSQAQAIQGSIVQLCVLIGGVAFTISNNLLGPLMGISSMLWLMMRNDSAINPRLAWMVFGAWLFFGLTYFMLQCHRVSNHRLFIFLSLALASICMCIVALLQRSSLQNGLVTVIPPCASFAVYSVAYFFPSRCQENRFSEV